MICSQAQKETNKRNKKKVSKQTTFLLEPSEGVTSHIFVFIFTTETEGAKKEEKLVEKMEEQHMHTKKNWIADANNKYK